MYVRALQGFHHYGTVRRGELIEVNPDVARQLIANGLVVEMQEQPAAPVPPAPPVVVPVIAPVNEQEAPKVRVGPFEPSQPGGKTGGEKQPSLLRPARPQKTPRSKSAAAAPASSRSTRAGNSALGPKSSTPVTTGGGGGTKGFQNSEGSD